MHNLFASDPEETYIHPQKSLTSRMRPKSLEDFIGQSHLLKTASPLSRILEADNNKAFTYLPASIILWGPPGTGKTSLAHILSQGKSRKFIELSAINATVKDLRNILDQALNYRDMYGKITILFLDEIHRFNKSQQDILLPAVENNWIVLVAATTENPSFSVISPLLSRSIVLNLKPLTDEELKDLIIKATRNKKGLNNKFILNNPTLEHLARLSTGDARRALVALEAAAAIAHKISDTKTDSTSQIEITTKHISEALHSSIVSYDKKGSSHYDVASAFIKSIRGSDVDAALHYLARMIEAGEDPKFITRRLIISAAEDIGISDPQALQIAVSAAQSIALIGMPEGRIVLAEAVIYLTTAPKSNAAYLAIEAALEDVRNGMIGEIPEPLKSSSYSGATSLGHGVGYKYSHDTPNGVAEQQYPPDILVGKNYYNPTVYGEEKKISTRVNRIREILRGSKHNLGDK